MVDVYPYLIERLPRRLPVYKERTSNVYLDVYLFMFFLKSNVYLLYELGRLCIKNWVDFAMKKGRRCTTGENQQKRLFYSCFSTEVDVLTLLGRHSRLTLFFDISRREIPCLGRRWPRFLHKHVLFFDFWRLNKL